MRCQERAASSKNWAKDAKIAHQEMQDVKTDLGANYKKILRLSYDVIITYDNRKSNLR